MTVYYNEFDPYAAAWLRNLIAAGHIPAGDVDERDIRDVSAADLRRYTQCHFFAGIGGWPLALRLAGWDRPVWTGSCPCQPFSAAGQRKGTDDERHLWPAFRWLIDQCRPPVIFGEQVASKDGRQWLAGVRTDLERMAYAVGATDLCSASVGAPHIRQRLWWVADLSGAGRRPERPDIDATDSDQEVRAGQAESRRCGATSRVANVLGAGLEGRDQGEVGHERTPAERSGSIGGLEHPTSDGRIEGRCVAGGRGQGRKDSWFSACGEGRDAGESAAHHYARLPGLSTDFWSAYDIVPCADGKARRVEPGTFPLAHGVSARVGKLRAYGNAITPQVAAEFIRAWQETRA